MNIDERFQQIMDNFPVEMILIRDDKAINYRSHTIQSMIRNIVSQFPTFNQNSIPHQHDLTPPHQRECFDVNGVTTLTEKRAFVDYWLPELAGDTFWAFFIGFLMGNMTSDHACDRYVLEMIATYFRVLRR